MARGGDDVVDPSLAHLSTTQVDEYVVGHGYVLHPGPKRCRRVRGPSSQCCDSSVGEFIHILAKLQIITNEIWHFTSDQARLKSGRQCCVSLGTG